MLIPNLTSAIVGSAFLTATVVLGEFTIASLLLKRTLPTYLVLYQNQQPQGGMALALVIFLATAKYNLATVYVINRVEAGEYPLAIAYSAVLILVMLFVLLAMQLLVGDTRLGRRSAPALVTGN